MSKIPELRIYDEIGGEGVTAQGFIEELKALGDVPKIRVRINSHGGSVTDGVAIHNALREHPAHVTTTIDGGAASISFYIAMAGDEREAAENSLSMMHGSRCETGGNASDHEQNLAMLKAADNAMAKRYAEILKKPTDEVISLLERDQWMGAQDALERGLITSIVPATDIAAKFSGKLLAKTLNTGAWPQPTVTGQTEEIEMTKPTAATPAELRKAFPNASVETLFAMAEEGQTMEEAEKSYAKAMEEENQQLKAQLKAMEEEKEASAKAEEEENAKAEEEKMKAMEEEKAKATAKSGTKPVATFTPSPTATSPIAQWDQLIAANVEKGMSRTRAVQMANKQNPGLRAQVVQAANG